MRAEAHILYPRRNACEPFTRYPRELSIEFGRTAIERESVQQGYGQPIEYRNRTMVQGRGRSHDRPLYRTPR